MKFLSKNGYTGDEKVILSKKYQLTLTSTLPESDHEESGPIKYDKSNFRMMTMERKGCDGQRLTHPWLEGRLDESRWPDHWLAGLHIFAALAALAVILFLIFGRRLFQNRCMSCCVTDKVKIW